MLGSSLFLDLYIGIILAIFSKSGMSPVSRDLLIRIVSSGASSVFKLFISIDVSLSGPQLFFWFQGTNNFRDFNFISRYQEHSLRLFFFHIMHVMES